MSRARSRTVSALAVALMAVLALVAAACGGDDAALRSFGAAGANELSLAIEVHDGWIAGEGQGAPGSVPVFTIPAHSDLTLHVRNAGTATHSLTMYASADAPGVLAETGAIAPGGEATMRFHFHDAQSALLRDDTQPSTPTAHIVVEMP